MPIQKEPDSWDIVASVGVGLTFFAVMFWVLVTLACPWMDYPWYIPATCMGAPLIVAGISMLVGYLRGE